MEAGRLSPSELFDQVKRHLKQFRESAGQEYLEMPGVFKKISATSHNLHEELAEIEKESDLTKIFQKLTSFTAIVKDFATTHSYDPGLLALSPQAKELATKVYNSDQYRQLTEDIVLLKEYYDKEVRINQNQNQNKNKPIAESSNVLPAAAESSKVSLGPTISKRIEWLMQKLTDIQTKMGNVLFFFKDTEGLKNIGELISKCKAIEADYSPDVDRAKIYANLVGEINKTIDSIQDKKSSLPEDLRILVDSLPTIIETSQLVEFMKYTSQVAMNIKLKHGQKSGEGLTQIWGFLIEPKPEKNIENYNKILEVTMENMANRKSRRGPEDSYLLYHYINKGDVESLKKLENKTHAPSSAPSSAQKLRK